MARFNFQGADNVCLLNTINSGFSRQMSEGKFNVPLVSQQLIFHLLNFLFVCFRTSSNDWFLFS